MSTHVAENVVVALLEEMNEAAGVIVRLDTEISVLGHLMNEGSSTATEEKVLKSIRSRKVAARAAVEAALAELGTELDAAIAAREAAAK